MSEKLSPGDLIEISARTWNEIIDAKDGFLRHKGDRRHDNSSAIASPVEIKNATGSDLRKGEVVEFGGNALDDSQIAQDVFWVKGVTPDETHAGFGIAAEPIPVDAIGPCVTSGTCMARVNVTDLNHKYARPAAGTTLLQSADSGPVRIDYAPGQGQVECIVTIAPTIHAENTIVFTLIEPLTLGGQARALRAELTAGGPWLPTGEEIIVVDSGKVWSGLLGYSGIAFERPDKQGQRQKYEIIFMQRSDLIVAFELNVDRNPALDFMVCRLLYSFQQGNHAPPNPVAGFITVHDPLRLFKHALQGGRGYAIYNDRADRYEALACQQRCFLARAVCNESPGSGMQGAGYAQIRSFEAISPPPFDQVPSPLPTQAINWFGHRCKADDDLLVSWDEAASDWVIVGVQKHDVPLVRDIRINDDKTAIQVKLQTVATEIATDAESDEQDQSQDVLNGWATHLR